MKPWKIVSIVGLFVVVAVSLLIFFGGMGVKKKQANNNKRQTTQTAQTSQQQKEEVKQSTTTVEVTESSTTQASAVKEETKKSDSETYALANVDFPNFKTTGSSRAVVSGKKVYKLGTSYVFNIIMTVPTETNGNIEVEYLTTFNNYNSVKIGSLVAVEYGISSDGAIAITSAKPI